MKQSEVVLAV